MLIGQPIQQIVLICFLLESTSHTETVFSNFSLRLCENGKVRMARFMDASRREEKERQPRGITEPELGTLAIFSIRRLFSLAPWTSLFFLPVSLAFRVHRSQSSRESPWIDETPSSRLITKIRSVVCVFWTSRRENILERLNRFVGYQQCRRAGNARDGRTSLSRKSNAELKLLARLPWKETTQLP